MVHIVEWKIGPAHFKYTAVLSDGRSIFFGHKDYPIYKDRTPLKLYTHLEHRCKTRRDRYRRLHGGEIDEHTGEFLVDQKFSPEWFMFEYLWK